MRTLFLCSVMAIAACASSGSSPTGPKDLGGMGGGICPAHPQFCSGQCCGSTCTNTMIDPNNCGGCMATCDKGQVCTGGRCGCLPTGAPCASTQTCCPNAGCANLMNDLRNCGACGHSCGEGSSCVNGTCVCGSTTCTGTQVCCSGACADSCMSSQQPDMAVSSGLPLCDCTGLVKLPIVNDQCPLSHQCVGMNCCAEDTVGLGNVQCTADPNCQPSVTPQ